LPETNEFVALGHGIVDTDSECLLEIGSGEITTTDVISIVKGSSGNPGEVRGTINDETFGEIKVNSNFGIFGTIENEEVLDLDSETPVEVALRNEIEIGEAQIITDVNGERKSYEVYVEKIYLDDLEDNKSFVIRVVDEELINTVGGIIRGLSGSPIMQNGKLIRNCY
jgi:stage IV sporulation protein B